MNKTKKIQNDLEQGQWARDIQSFGLLKKLLGLVTMDSTKELIRARMREIQARWPQFIKPSEIPE